MGKSIFFVIFMLLPIIARPQKIGFTFTPPMTSNGVILSHRAFGNMSMAYGAEHKRLPDNSNGTLKLSMGMGLNNGNSTDFFAMANISGGKMYKDYGTVSMELGFIHSFSFNRKILCMSFFDVINSQLKIGVGIDISPPIKRPRKRGCK